MYFYDDYAQELRERICATNQLAKDHLKQEKIKAKLQYDKSVNEKSRIQGPTLWWNR